MKTKGGLDSSLWLGPPPSPPGDLCFVHGLLYLSQHLCGGVSAPLEMDSQERGLWIPEASAGPQAQSQGTGFPIITL